MSKAEEIVKEITKHCKHGFNLTPKTCAYCQGYPISDYLPSIKWTYTQELDEEEH